MVYIELQTCPSQIDFVRNIASVEFQEHKKIIRAINITVFSTETLQVNHSYNILKRLSKPVTAKINS